MKKRKTRFYYDESHWYTIMPIYNGSWAINGEWIHDNTEENTCIFAGISSSSLARRWCKALIEESRIRKEFIVYFIPTDVVMIKKKYQIYE